MKKRNLIIIVSVILILICIISFALIKSNLKENNKENETSTETETVFTSTEEYLANKIKQEFANQNYIKSENTKNFKITKFQQYGYFKSEPNVRYIYVYYEYECKDGTTNCVNIPYAFPSKDNTFMIVIDLADQNYLKFQKGFSSTIDQMDDLVQDYSTIPEYINTNQ